MKAISLWEPWGTAIALGLKQIETRHWQTAYRGPLAIHCAKTREHTNFIRDPLVKKWFAAYGIKEESQLAFGCIVAVCTLSVIMPTERLIKCGSTSPLEEAFGNYEPGRFGWQLRDVVQLRTPVPWKGCQGLFNVPDEALNEPF